MTLEEELEFLAWYFTFIDPEFISCSQCGHEMNRLEAEASYDAAQDAVICPECGHVNNKDSFLI